MVPVLRVITAFLAFGLTGCSVYQDWFPTPAPTSAVEVKQRLTASVMTFDKCPVYESKTTAQIAPLIAAVAPFLIQAGASALADALQKANNDLTTTYTAYGAVAAGSNPDCLVIFRGKVGTPTKALKAEGLITPGVLTEIGAVEQPSIYIEIKMTAVNGTSRQFRPVFVQFNDTAAPNPGNGKKTVGVVLYFSPTPQPPSMPSSSSSSQPSSNPTGAVAHGSAAGHPSSNNGTSTPTPPSGTTLSSTAVPVPFSLGELKRGTYLLGGPGASPATNDLFNNQVRLVPIKSGGQSLPSTLNAWATVTESADPTFFDSEVQKAVASQGFATAVQAILLPSSNSSTAGKPASSTSGK